MNISTIAAIACSTFANLWLVLHSYRAATPRYVRRDMEAADQVPRAVIPKQQEWQIYRGQLLF